MGLFGVFKRKRKETVLNELKQAEDFGAIAKILSDNGLISKPKDNFHNTLGEDLRHLTPDGELPFGWLVYYQDFTGEKGRKIADKWKAVRNAVLTQDKLDAYRDYFATIASVGEECKEAGECHYKWFCENFLESVSYNEEVKDYRRLKADAPSLIKHENLLSTLEYDVMAKLRECNGIIQSEFLKTFDPLIKDEVSAFLRESARTGKIERTKSGRSYILKIKE
jgi:hypothetical protein